MKNEKNGLESELNQSVDEQAVAWLIRLKSQKVSSEDRALFFRWLKQADAHREAFDEISKLWGDEDLLQALNEAARQYRIAPHKKSRAYFKWPLAMVACLTLALILNGEFWMRADYSTGVGERKTVYLEDGSFAMLNTGSSIIVNMEGAQRSVKLLKGEVYFDVKPDAKRPFIVQADHSTTRVLGTRFFVQQNRESDEIKVLSGRVEVRDQHAGKQSLILHDRERVIVNAQALGEARQLDSVLTTSWVNGFLVFEDATLESVIDQISRYRTGFVVYKNDALRELKINGRINLGEPGDMLKVLEKDLSVKMTYLTDWWVIVG